MTTKMFGDVSGLSKLPVGPPKFKKVLNSLKDMLHESENAHHAGCSILRCADHFWHGLDTIKLFPYHLLHSARLSFIFADFRKFSKIFENFVIFVIMTSTFVPADLCE